MIKRFCDVCGKEINRYIEHEWRDHEMQFYKLVKVHFDSIKSEYETDICNECLHKVVALTRCELAEMRDLIYRQDTIDYLMTNMVWYDENGYEEIEDEKLNAITDLINGVPSAAMRGEE